MENIHASATTKSIFITNHITFNDFLKHSFILLLKSKWLFLVILACLYAYIGYVVMAGNTGGNGLSTFYLIITLVIFVVIPAVMYFELKKYYTTNKSIKENILYTFTNEGIETKGETFSSKLAWKTLYKIEEMNDMLLLYTDKYIAIRIYKKNFKSVEDMQELRNMIKSQPTKQKLKK